MVTHTMCINMYRRMCVKWLSFEYFIQFFSLNLLLRKIPRITVSEVTLHSRHNQREKKVWQDVYCFCYFFCFWDSPGRYSLHNSKEVAVSPPRNTYDTEWKTRFNILKFEQSKTLRVHIKSFYVNVFTKAVQKYRQESLIHMYGISLKVQF